MWDIHALQETFYFGNSVIPVIKNAAPLFIHELEQKFPREKVSIAFPDEGAWKRFGKEYDFPLVVCSKKRVSKRRIITVVEGEEHIFGKHVFIVDDLVKTGGTLWECKEALLSMGAENVSAFVTHAVFPMESWKRFLPSLDQKPFYSFYVTDSCPMVAKAIEDKAPFKVLSLKPQIISLLRSLT
eukprot:TRINITY_DN766_c2_g1_i4.p1 TRINITY_DN766_c2_g1~~TRINITY_DN766_c2_g1_i4.p1  ORF type:complete len:184 (+),score=35.04 TRINITY_DN766_c2_g1_i4:688-1239(+)